MKNTSNVETEEIASSHHYISTMNSESKKFLEENDITPQNMMAAYKLWRKRIEEGARDNTATKNEPGIAALDLLNVGERFPTDSTNQLNALSEHRPKSGLLSRVVDYFSQKRKKADFVKPFLEEPGLFSELHGKRGTQVLEKFVDGAPGPVMVLSEKRLKEIPDGTPVYSMFDGKKVIKTKDISLDTRKGFTAFGLRPTSHSDVEVPMNKVADRIDEQVRAATGWWSITPTKTIKLNEAMALMTNRYPGLQKSLVEYMTGRSNLSDAEILAEGAKLRAWMLEQYPQLSRYDETNAPKSGQEWNDWVTNAEKTVFGRRIQVMPWREDGYKKIDTSEFEFFNYARKAGDAKLKEAISSNAHYYEILGVNADASIEELKKAYRTRAKEYHPDVSQNADAEEQFKRLGEAYGVLSDPEKRSYYDRIRN
jgi:DnaJ-domain-containing protein 1